MRLRLRDETGGLAAHVPVLRRTSFSAYRSGGYHADHARKFGVDGAVAGWPEGMYSLLAGFVEPGETLEAAVRREVFEEAGIRVGQVEYLSSQPWPFPASLMFGCKGEALTRDIEIDPQEIEDAIWVTREEMLAIFAGEHETILPARKGAIAHFLLENWLADTLE